jgi:hypothetical protein
MTSILSRRKSVAMAGISLLTPLTAQAATSALVISSGATTDVACLNGTCKATASDAVLNVGQLQTLLANGNVTVTTGSASDDIKVTAALGWAAGSTLALDARHSIVIDAPVADNGPGALSLKTNDGGSRGLLSFGAKGNVTFASVSNSLTIDGKKYELVDSVASLASAANKNPKGFYALAKSYDAKKDGTYSSSPVIQFFFGAFEGLGNTISNLSITDTFPGDAVGLFAFSAGTIADFSLIDVKIIGPFGATVGSPPTDVGAVAGVTNFEMRGVFVSGEISAGDFVTIGGVVSLNEAAMTNCRSTADVKGRNNSWVGGLAGSNNGGGITDSFATGRVSGGDVSYSGGLAGYNYGPLIRTHATGAVSGGNSASVGGLVGTAEFVSDIFNSFATGPVTAGTSANAGGLVGVNAGGIGASFATGTASAFNTAKVGGLVGFNGGSIGDSYATGGVSVGNLSYAGGLVGFAESGYTGIIQRSYSTGSIKAGSGAFVGGMLGFDNISFRALTDTYWGTTTSGITDLSKGAGNKKNDPGIAGLTTAQLQSGLPDGFMSTVWGEKSSINSGLPYLLANSPRGSPLSEIAVTRPFASR